MENSSDRFDEKLTIHVLLDTTGSMSNWFQACKVALMEMLTVCSLLGKNMVTARVITFKDYDVTNVLKVGKDLENSLEVLRNEDLSGGADAPEAVKTALTYLIDERKNDENLNIAFVFTDNPPHMNHPEVCNSPQQQKEAEALGSRFNIFNIQKELACTNIKVVTFLPPAGGSGTSKFFFPVGSVRFLESTDVDGIRSEMIRAFNSFIGQDEPLSVCVAKEPLELETEEELPASIEYTETKMEFEGLGGIQETVQKEIAGLPELIKKDNKTKNEIIKSFKEIMTPEYVRALKYNNVIGKLWRTLAPMRRYDQNVNDLCDAFARAVEPFEDMKEWVEETYDETPFIEETISKYSSKIKIKAHEDTRIEVPKKDARSILRGNPDSNVAYSIVRAFQEIQIAESDTGIPSDISDEELFKVLMHIFYPGMLGTFRASAVIAMVALVSKSPLQERAYNYLSGIVGKWMGTEEIEVFPEVCSLQFILLARKLPSELLSEGELEFLWKAYYMWRYKRTLKSTVTVRVPKRIKMLEERVDDRVACQTCNQSRPLSIIQNGVCGLCYVESDVPSPEISKLGMSHMAMCRVCYAVYGVEAFYDLKITPKCHACRNDLEFNKNQCTDCLSFHIRQDEKKSPNWKCPPCRNNQPFIESLDLSLEVLFQENPALFRVLEYKFDSISASSKLFAVLTQQTIEKQVAEFPDKLFYGGLQLLDSKEVSNRVSVAVLENMITDLCEVCFSEKSLEELRSPCGKCSSKCCSECRVKWFGIQPGEFPVSLSRFYCMFCRKFPTFKALRNGNPNAPRQIVQEEGMLLGFCSECRVVKPVVAIECGRDVQEARNWVCELCSNWKSEQEVKSCPSCKTLVEKIGGCNHITCVCGAHWCYECGAEPEEDIYEHMHSEHGGIGV